MPRSGVSARYKFLKSDYPPLDNNFLDLSPSEVLDHVKIANSPHFPLERYFDGYNEELTDLQKIGLVEQFNTIKVRCKWCGLNYCCEEYEYYEFGKCIYCILTDAYRIETKIYDQKNDTRKFPEEVDRYITLHYGDSGYWIDWIVLNYDNIIDTTNELEIALLGLGYRKDNLDFKQIKMKYKEIYSKKLGKHDPESKIHEMLDLTRKEPYYFQRYNDPESALYYHTKYRKERISKIKTEKRLKQLFYDEKIQELKNHVLSLIHDISFHKEIEELVDFPANIYPLIKDIDLSSMTKLENEKLFQLFLLYYPRPFEAKYFDYSNRKFRNYLKSLRNSDKINQIYMEKYEYVKDHFHQHLSDISLIRKIAYDDYKGDWFYPKVSAFRKLMEMEDLSINEIIEFFLSFEFIQEWEFDWDGEYIDEMTDLVKYIIKNLTNKNAKILLQTNINYFINGYILQNYKFDAKFLRRLLIHDDYPSNWVMRSFKSLKNLLISLVELDNSELYHEFRRVFRYDDPTSETLSKILSDSFILQLIRNSSDVFFHRYLISYLKNKQKLIDIISEFSNCNMIVDEITQLEDIELLNALLANCGNEKITEKIRQRIKELEN